MKPVRIPKTEKAAATLCERYADTEARIAAAENARNAQLAEINAAADELIAPLVKERTAIAEKLEPWWGEAGHALTNGKRKSIALGGCEIGTKTTPVALAVDGDAKAIAAALQQQRWAKPLLRVSVSIDRRNVLKSLDGVYRTQLEALGCRKVDARETFYVKAVEQHGTLAGAGS